MKKSDRESEVFKDEGSRHLSSDLTRRSKLSSTSTLVADQIPTTYSNGQTLVDGGDLFVKKCVHLT